MKTKLLALSVLVLATRAFGLSYTDTDWIDFILDGSHPSYTSTFNIVLDGYNPATQVVTSATADFEFYDHNNGSESFHVTIGGADFGSGHSFSGFDNLSGSVTGLILVDLSADGIVSYTVFRDSGEFKLKEATLCAQVTTRTTSVPDGGSTLALLGGALLLLGAFRRWRL